MRLSRSGRHVALAVAGVVLLLTGACLWWLTRPPVRASPSVSDPTAAQRRTASRLSREKSPYLRQHADNLVDWYPWGKEAFEKAKRENKPIFLSVGYSTCHWCHVMERESFMDPEVARLLNTLFVPVKVDREERPDVDRIYMAYVMSLTGSGGWPMSVWLTPDREPFYGGTYYPPEEKWGRPGLRQILARISELWQSDRDKLEASARDAAGLLKQMGAAAPGGPAPSRQALERAFAAFSGSYDERRGGFGGAPKFPRPTVLTFLLRHHAGTGDTSARDMAVATLRAMAAGGIHDHLGGGFHRYSTDERWHVPHFEKMLYDQAQLAWAYLDAFQVTGDAALAAAARDILAYVERDLSHPDGGFYSAEDADSVRDPAKPEEHFEGAFYVWTAQELDDALGPLAKTFRYAYGVEDGGNARGDRTGELAGQNVLFRAHDAAEVAKHFGRPAADVERDLEKARRTLLAARARRPRPHLDDKVVTAWNGLMISAFARAHQVLGDDAYLARARRAADFVLTRLSHEGTLRRHYREGAADVPAFNEDYAALIGGLLDLYESSFEIRWLQAAVRLQEEQIALFWDEPAGGFYETTGQDPTVLVRTREMDDGAEPASNSLSAMNLLRLSRMLDREDFAKRADRTLGALSGVLARNPEALPHLLSALDFSLAPNRQIVIAGRPDDARTRRLLRVVHERYLPNRVLLLADGGDGQDVLSGYMEFIKSVRMLDGVPTAYICENHACERPVTEPAQVRQMLIRPHGGQPPKAPAE